MLRWEHGSILPNYDRQTQQPTNQPTERQTNKQTDVHRVNREVALSIDPTSESANRNATQIFLV